MIRHVCVASILSFLLAQTALAESPLEPVGKWVVDYAKDQCLLSRAYSADEKKPLILTFEKIPMSTNVGLFLLKSTGQQYANSGKARIGYGGGSPKEARFSAYTAAHTSIRKIAIQADEDVLNGAAKSGYLSVDVKGEAKDSFAVPNLQAAFHALDDCALDLGRLWGIPIAEQKRIKVPAKLAEPADRYFSSSDYPDRAVRNGESGMAKVRVSVDATGRPTNCVLSRTTGSTMLDQTTCRLFMQRVRFQPALDMNGQPMPSLYVNTIFWLLG
jgi:TonB family protein